LNYSENRKVWEERIERYSISGLTQELWCEQENVKVTALRYWLRKLREENGNQEAPWVKLETVLPEKTKVVATKGVTLRIGSFSLEVTDGFSPDVLKDVVRALNEIC